MAKINETGDSQATIQIKEGVNMKLKAWSEKMLNSHSKAELAGKGLGRRLLRPFNVGIYAGRLIMAVGKEDKNLQMREYLTILEKISPAQWKLVPLRFAGRKMEKGRKLDRRKAGSVTRQARFHYGKLIGHIAQGNTRITDML